MNDTGDLLIVFIALSAIVPLSFSAIVDAVGNARNKIIAAIKENRL